MSSPAPEPGSQSAGGLDGSGIDPAVAPLFEIEGDAWIDRLRRAHEKAPLGMLGAYELMEEVGRGGQGEVYSARQPGTGRVVALKRVAGLGFAPSKALTERFAREVESLTRLSHPNVVAVHAMDVIDRHSVLVMEYVRGETIDRWADRVWTSGDRPLQRVLGVFGSVCGGVAHAHQRGVLHRDLKPSNVLVTPEDMPKVLDFGIARLVRDSAPSGEDAARWTATGFAGTPAYAAPEQTRPGTPGVDTRSDIYSLGVLLYRVLAGREAFDAAAGLPGVLAATAAGPAPGPCAARPGLPAECDWIVRKATDPEPARRYQSVEALAEDVRRLLDGRAVLAHPPSAWYITRRAIARRPWSSAAIIIGLLSVGSLGALAAVQAIRLGDRSTALAAALETANAQRVRAEREEERQRQMSRRLTKATMGAVNNDTYFISTDVPLIDTLYELVKDLTPDDDDDTTVELRMRLAFALSHARRQSESDAQFLAARDASERIDGPSSERASRIVLRWSWTLRSLNRPEDALGVIDRAIDRASAAPRTIYSAALIWERMFVLNALDRPTAEVLDCARELILRCDEHEDRPSERARAREEAAGIAFARSEFAQSQAWYREALEIGLSANIDAQSLSRFRASVGRLEVINGNIEAAEPFLRSAADYRIQFESATGNRAHQYLQLHAEILHRLGRYTEAAARWELALLKPLAARQPEHRAAAIIRFRLAASRLAAGQREAGLTSLALAISDGQTENAGDPALKEQAAAIEAALRENQWQFDDQLRVLLVSAGNLGFLADPIDPPALSRASAASPRPNLPPAPRPPPPDPPRD